MKTETTTPENENEFTLSEKTADYLRLCRRYLDVLDGLGQHLNADERFSTEQAEDLFEQAFESSFMNTIRQIINDRIFDNLMQGNMAV